MARAKLAPGAANTYQGYATNFASPGDLARFKAAKAAGKSDEQAWAVGDNGVGAPNLGTVNTANSYGVAAPTEYLRRHFGNDPADWRTARAEITSANGQTIRVPFVDIGPGQKQQKAGIITDLTYPLSQGLQTGDKSRVTISYVPQAGPDYLKDRDAWDQEQHQIGNQFFEPSPTPAMPLQSSAPDQASSDDQPSASDYASLGGSLGAVNA